MSEIKQLKHALDALYDARRRLYEVTNELSEEELFARPSAEAWSIGEIMDHLIKAEEHYGSQLREKLIEGDRSTTDNVASQILRPIVLRVLRSSRFNKSKTIPELEPVHGYPHLYLVRKLAQVRDRTLDVAERLTDQFSPIYLRDPRSNVVFSGEEWLNYIACHELRHIKQIEHTLAEVKGEKIKDEG